MTSQTRANRVADRIGQELAVILQQEVSDPRLPMLTITDVEVDRELAFATVYVSAIEADQAQILEVLQGARGFLRSKLAARIRLRSFPQLRFRWDHSPDRGARVDELLERLQGEPGEPQGDGG